MSKVEILLGVLAVIALIGVIVLAVLKIDTQVLVPILTALIGALIGKKSELIAGSFKRLGSKRK